MALGGGSGQQSGGCSWRRASVWLSCAPPHPDIPARSRWRNRPDRLHWPSPGARSPVVASGAMEADADPEELTRLRSVFATYDTKGSGRLERAEFGALCAELHVAEAEAEAVFLGLDTDRDGAITFPEFARGFRGALGPDGAEAQGSWDAAEPESPGPAWRDFHARLGDEAQLIPRCVVRRAREACASQPGRLICELLFLFNNCR